MIADIVIYGICIAFLVLVAASIPGQIRQQRENDEEWRKYWNEKKLSREYRDIPSRLDKWLAEKKAGAS
jgi:hypothetical protein